MSKIHLSLPRQNTPLVIRNIAPNDTWYLRVPSGVTCRIIEENIHSGFLEIGNGAIVELILIHTVPTKKNIIPERVSTIHRDGVLRTFHCYCAEVTLSSITKLQGDHAVSEHHVVYFAHEREKIHLTLETQHLDRNAMSRMMVRGVAVGSSHVTLHGNIRIAHCAGGADGHLQHEGILMGRNARIDALPALNIKTNDVKAKHSSAIHFIRPEQLLYARARGIATAEAQRMIIEGFLTNMMTFVRDTTQREKIHKIFSQKTYATFPS